VRRAILGLAATLLVALPRAGAAATVAGTVTVDGRAAEQTVVYLEGATPAPAASAEPVVVDQRDLAFVPTLLAIVRGTVVEFKNSDDVRHNVFSPSAAGGTFDLGTYSRGESRRVTFDEPGEVAVLCNIHMEMQAHIVVLRDPFFATTRPGGAYTIERVPPGTYTLKVWRKRWLPLERAVEVPAAGTLALDVEG